MKRNTTLEIFEQGIKETKEKLVKELEDRLKPFQVSNDVKFIISSYFRIFELKTSTIFRELKMKYCEKILEAFIDTKEPEFHMEEYCRKNCINKCLDYLIKEDSR